MAELIDFGSKVHYTSDSPMRWGQEQAISGANKIRDFNRQRAVETALSQNYNPETKEFNRTGIAKSLADKGFGASTEQVLNQIAADRTKLSSETADAINKDFNLITLNIMSPKRFIEKWGGTTEAQAYVDNLTTIDTQKVQEASQAQVKSQVTETAPEQPIDLYAKKPEKTPTLPENYFGSLDNPVTRRLYELFGKKSAQSSVETPSESTVDVPGNEFTSKLPEYKLEDTIPRTEYKIVTNDPTTTTNYLAIDTTPEKLASMFPDVSSDPKSIASSIFSTKGMTQEEQDNLNRYLARGGYVKPGDTLEDSVARFESSYLAGVSQPVPPQPGKNMVEERARFAKEQAEYTAKVSEALNKARADMRAGYADVQGTEQSRKTFESIRADMDDPTKFYGVVTQEKAKKIMEYRRYWPLFENASRSWKDAWSAAVALGKVEGNPTLENAVSIVIEMGAIPSKDAAIVKMVMSENLQLANLGAAKGFDFLTKKMKEYGIDLNLSPKGADGSWGKRFISETTQLFKDSNAYMLKFTPAKPQDSSGDTTGDTTQSGAKKAADGYHNAAKKFTGKDPLGLGM